MAFTQKERFNLLPQLVAEMSKPMSHPARVKIMMYLLKHGDTRFSEFLTLLPLSGPTISQHLRVLRRSNLILVHEETPHTLYDVNMRQLQKHMAVMLEFLTQLRQSGVGLKDLIPAEDLKYWVSLWVKEIT
ncbi:MAG TPA: winged helix-turn-helix domain-containing protein [Saprospiraceae bacterium]|nr:winged helix-turn-helix domain-containing protein [Saprospiraceae bacterium]